MIEVAGGGMLRDVFLWGRPRSVGRAAAYLVVAVLAVLAANPAALRAPDMPVFNDGHALVSMNTALSYAYCGRAYHASSRFHVPARIMEDDSLRRVPLPQVIVRLSGTLDAYCASLHGHANNENSLMLLQAAVMRVHPSVSVVQLGWLLHGVRVAAVLAFALLLLELGGGVLMAASVIALMLGVLDGLRDFLYSNYPFLFLIVVANATLCGFALHRRWASSRAGCVMLGLAAGLLAAFSANLRTSYLPIVMAEYGMFLAAELLVTRAEPRRRLRSGLLAGGFLVAFGAFQVGLISRFFPEESRQAQHHSVAHPLVLALSMPPNPLSRELGITWLDAVGAEKALSVDPTAYFLGPRYDPALFHYYRSLWRSRPWQMLDVYRMKFSSVGPDMLADLRLRPWLIDLPVNVLLAPLAWLPNGLWILACYTAIMVVAAVRFVRRKTTVPFVIVLLSAAAVLVTTEAGLIYSLWVPQYHNYLAVWALLLSLASAQILVNCSAALAVRAAGSRRAALLWVQARRFFGVDAMPASTSTLPRGASMFLQCGLIILLFVVTIPAGWYVVERTPTTDRTAAAGVDAALRLALCGSVSAGSAVSRPGQDAILDPALQLVPFRDLVVERAGSIAAFCSGAGGAAAIDYGPLTALNAAILASRPRISAAGLGKVLHYLRLGLIVAIAALMLSMGLSPALVYAVSCVELWVLVTLRHHLFSGAAFAPLLALLTVLAYSSAMARWTGSPARIYLAAAAGAWAVFATTIAPALGPVQWLWFGLFLITVSLRGGTREGALMTVSFVVASVPLALVLGMPSHRGTDPVYEAVPPWLSSVGLGVALMLATIAIARWRRRSPDVLATAALFAAAAATFSQVRLVFSDRPPASDVGLVLLLATIVVLAGAQQAVRAAWR